MQHKGRFKVTSAELCPKGPTSSSLSAASVLPSLHSILQQNTMQREEIIKLIKLLEQTYGNHMEFAEAGSNDLSQISHASTRERELQSQVIHLQQRIGSLVEELQRQKTKNLQLERQLKAFVNKEER